MKTAKERINFLLRTIPATRNSDSMLYTKYINIFCPWALSNDRKYVLLSAIPTIPSQADLQRIRAIIQNIEGKYPPTSFMIARKRKMKRTEWEKIIKEIT